ETFARSEDVGAYDVPVGVAGDEGFVPRVQVRGAVDRRAWRVPVAGLTPEQVLAPLARAVDEAGWEVLVACAARACGGFDFRFALDLRPPPEMFVDLGAFSALTARAADGGAHLVAVASATPEAGWLEVIQVAPGGGTLEVERAAAPLRAAPRGDLAQRLEAQGAVVLEGLAFASGSAALPVAEYPPLRDLATYLAGDAARRVVVVGHTDATGSLEGNLRISRARAEAVRTALVERFGAAGAQIAAEGAGYLAPRDSNLTEAGRAANRRVEVVLLDTR
ncbi:MAG: OmpA family protein, partial [Shimia sp.]